MVRILTVLFISSVFVFGICKGDSKERKKLENDIKKAEDKISTVIKANAKLSEEITKVTKLYTSKIKISDDLKKKKNEQIKKLQNEIEDLHRQLVGSYLEEDEIRKALINIEKLKLDIKVTEENIKMLEERRKNNISTSCWKLEGMAKNHKNLLRVSVLASGKTDESIILKNKLRLVLKELDQANKKNADLKMELIYFKKFLYLYNKNVEEAIKKLSDDIKKGQEIIDKSKKALEEQRKKVAELKKSCEANKNELDKWKKEAKKVVDKLNIYALDVECYKKLHNDMVTLVTSKP